MSAPNRSRPVATAVARKSGGISANPCAIVASRRPPKWSARLPPTSMNNMAGTSIAICASPTMRGDSCSTMVTSQANSTEWMPNAKNQELVPTR